MRLSLPLACALLTASLVGCTSSAPGPSMPPPPASTTVVTVAAAPTASVVAAAERSALDEVARVHGGADPWSVAGYRMGQRALSLLGLPRQSDDLEVTHRSPLMSPYAGVADGDSAATGASVGKVNLRFEEAPVGSMLTLYRRRSTGQTLALRPTEAFKKRYADVPRERLRTAGEQVLSLRDDEIFEVAPTETPPAVTPSPTTAAAPAASTRGKGDIRDPWSSQPAGGQGAVRDPWASPRLKGKGNWY